MATKTMISSEQLEELQKEYFPTLKWDIDISDGSYICLADLSCFVLELIVFPKGSQSRLYCGKRGQGRLLLFQSTNRYGESPRDALRAIAHWLKQHLATIENAMAD